MLGEDVQSGVGAQRNFELNATQNNYTARSLPDPKNTTQLAAPVETARATQTVAANRRR
jgi:hypothetical protein